jgi:hypothetical protein
VICYREQNSHFERLLAWLTVVRDETTCNIMVEVKRYQLDVSFIRVRRFLPVDFCGYSPAVS